MSMVTHSNIPAWRILWSEEPGRLQSVVLQRVGLNWSSLACTHTLFWNKHLPLFLWILMIIWWYLRGSVSPNQVKIHLGTVVFFMSLCHKITYNGDSRCDYLKMDLNHVTLIFFFPVVTILKIKMCLSALYSFQSLIRSISTLAFQRIHYLLACICIVRVFAGEYLQLNVLKKSL